MIFQLIVNDIDVLINKIEWNIKSTINNEQLLNFDYYQL